MPRHSARLKDNYQQPIPKKLCNSPINKKVSAASKDKAPIASEAATTGKK
jgi:hypothetical protein